MTIKDKIEQMRTKDLLTIVAVMLAMVLVASISSVYMTGSIVIKEQGAALLANRLIEMSLVALVIERSVEVYLRAFGQNGPDRHDPNPTTIEQLPATQTAMVVSIIVSVLVAALGVRVFDSFIEFTTAASGSTWPEHVWNGINILISGGLLAGGAAFLHEIVETLVGSVRTINSKVSPSANAFGGGPVTDSALATGSRESDRLVVATSDFTVSVTRTGASSGKLKFDNGNISIDAECWWDADNKIAAGNYPGCSKTRMTTKKDSVTEEPRPGIFLPTAKAPDTGKHTIFIHEGKDPSWSDGCIVLNRDDMIKMWNAIDPKNANNVTVSIVDETT